MEVGRSWGKYSKSFYTIRHCCRCRFSFVANPCTDFEKIYSAGYYSGRGADPLVDYVFELEHPRNTIRQYEWQGVLQFIRSLVSLGPDTKWLDFGCGNGGLVRYVSERAPCQIVGFEEGLIRDAAIAMKIPILDKTHLATRANEFDIVTAIEVLEHAVDPLHELTRIRRLLKTGGLLFLTTGNARPFRNRLLSWRYIIPEIHISFFEPETMASAMILAGFRPEFRNYSPGFANIIRFKVLKNLRARRPHVFEKILPWGILARLIDLRYKFSGHPIGWANNPPVVLAAIIGATI